MLRSLHNNITGMSSLQSVVVVGLSAIVVTSATKLWDDGKDGGIRGMTMAAIQTNYDPSTVGKIGQFEAASYEFGGGSNGSGGGNNGGGRNNGGGGSGEQGSSGSGEPTHVGAPPKRDPRNNITCSEYAALVAALPCKPSGGTGFEAAVKKAKQRYKEFRDGDRQGFDGFTEDIYFAEFGDDRHSHPDEVVVLKVDHGGATAKYDKGIIYLPRSLWRKTPPGQPSLITDLTAFGRVQLANELQHFKDDVRPTNKDLKIQKADGEAWGPGKTETDHKDNRRLKYLEGEVRSDDASLREIDHLLEHSSELDDSDRDFLLKKRITMKKRIDLLTKAHALLAAGDYQGAFDLANSERIVCGYIRRALKHPDYKPAACNAPSPTPEGATSGTIVSIKGSVSASPGDDVGPRWNPGGKFGIGLYGTELNFAGELQVVVRCEDGQEKTLLVNVNKTAVIGVGLTLGIINYSIQLA